MTKDFFSSGPFEQRQDIRVEVVRPDGSRFRAEGVFAEGTVRIFKPVFRIECGWRLERLTADGTVEAWRIIDVRLTPALGGNPPSYLLQSLLERPLATRPAPPAAGFRVPPAAGAVADESLRGALSTHVVTGFAEQRLSYLAEAIRQREAQFCAVLSPQRYLLLGLIRFHEVAARSEVANRILADLMEPPPALSAFEWASPGELLGHFEADAAPLIEVQSADGAFVGLVTPESFRRWQWKKERSLPQSPDEPAAPSIDDTASSASTPPPSFQPAQDADGGMGRLK